MDFNLRLAILTCLSALWLLACTTPQNVTSIPETSTNNSPASVSASVATPVSNIADIVDGVEPSVVHIQTDGTELDQFNEPAPNAKVGTGIIIDHRGHIVTNEHVIAGAGRVIVGLDDGRGFAAQVIGGDPLTDLAVLKINAKGLTPIPIGRSSTLRVGEPVIAVGHALDLPGGPSVTTGVVSAFRNRVADADNNRALRHLIQTDAAINPGNSGGPLLNLRGELVGINTSSAGAAEGISFAIAMDPVNGLIEELITQGRIERGFLGIVGVSVTEALAINLELSRSSGVSVAAIVGDSPASRAGLMVGDIIVGIEKEPVQNLADLDKILAQYKRRQSVAIEFYRGRHAHTVKVTLGDRPR